MEVRGKKGNKKSDLDGWMYSVYVWIKVRTRVRSGAADFTDGAAAMGSHRTKHPPL